MVKKKINQLKIFAGTFRKDLGEFGFKVACIRLHRDFPIGDYNKKTKRYNRVMLAYLDKRYSNYIKENHAAFRQTGEVSGKRQIWVMWWQGENGMPPIVKACYKRLLRVSKDCIVTLITKDNFRDYTDIPDYILEKVDSGAITLTHLSDIIRINLLKKWGGGMAGCHNICRSPSGRLI